MSQSKIVPINDNVRDQEFDEFINGFAHDLKNPLIGSNRILELLENHQLGSLTDKQVNVLRLIRESNESMLEMISDLLRVYRDEKTFKAVKTRTESLNKLIQNYLLKIQILMDDRNIELDIELDEVDPVSIDPVSMFRVVDNIVGNAIKFVPDGGRIMVKLWQNDQTNIVLQVSDTGPGILPDERKQLFGRYWRSKQNNASGNGLGLYVSQQIVQAHDGKIECDPECANGTTFTVRLPIAV